MISMRRFQAIEGLPHDSCSMARCRSFALLIVGVLIVSCVGVDDSSRARADRLSKEKKYQEAIDEYWRHIEDRLAVSERPNWENPYLYLLDIGDLYIEQGNVGEALRYYELAEEKHVKQGYVNDRYRGVAAWYESRGRLRDAIEHLEKYQDKDPLLFDLMLDRLSRELVEQEESKAKKSAGEREITSSKP